MRLLNNSKSSVYYTFNCNDKIEQNLYYHKGPSLLYRKINKGSLGSCKNKMPLETK